MASKVNVNVVPAGKGFRAETTCEGFGGQPLEIMKHQGQTRKTEAEAWEDARLIIEDIASLMSGSRGVKVGNS
jgi:hypothetical protein